VAWAEAYLRTKWHRDSSSHLATIDMAADYIDASKAYTRKLRKYVGTDVPLSVGGELDPHLT